MAHTLLTPSDISNESLRLLTQKLRFVNKVNRKFENEFARKNAKIGDTVDIRKPPAWIVREGLTMQPQDVTQQTVQLTINKVRHVAWRFNHMDLRLNLDEYMERNHIDSAMATLAQKIEAEALAMYKDIPNQVSDVSATVGFNDIVQAQKVLDDNLVPQDEDRYLLLNTKDNVSLVTDTKTLFNDREQIAQQYRTGYVGTIGGMMKAYNTTLLGRHGTGTYVATSAKQIDGANQTGSTIVVKNSVGTFSRGDIIQLPGVYRVHPVTKENTGRLMDFVVTEDLAGAGTNLKIYPAVTTTGEYQNVSDSPTANGTITKLESDHATPMGAGASTGISLAYHKDAFAFGMVELPVPHGHWGSSVTYDGISLSMVKAYDQITRSESIRIDAVFGFKAVYPEMACRLAFS